MSAAGRSAVYTLVKKWLIDIRRDDASRQPGRNRQELVVGDSEHLKFRYVALLPIHPFSPHYGESNCLFFISRLLGVCSPDNCSNDRWTLFIIRVLG